MYLPQKFAVPVNESCIISGHVHEVVKDVYEHQKFYNCQENIWDSLVSV